jgi:hypothetical protein
MVLALFPAFAGQTDASAGQPPPLSLACYLADRCPHAILPPRRRFTGEVGIRFSVGERGRSTSCGSRLCALSASSRTASHRRRSPIMIRRIVAIGMRLGSGLCSRCARTATVRNGPTTFTATAVRSEMTAFPSTRVIRSMLLKTWLCFSAPVASRRYLRTRSNADEVN